MKPPTAAPIDLPKQYQAHVPAMWWKRDEDGDLPTDYDGIARARFDKTGAVKVTFVDGEVIYFYKGREIYQDAHTPTGYYGRWRVGLSSKGHWDATLKACIEYIDTRDAEKAVPQTTQEKA